MSDSSGPPDTTRGFWRWVKNPWLRRRDEAWAADVEAELAAFDQDRVSDRAIRRLVEGLLHQELMWPATRKFERLGRRAVPHLLRALDDPRFLRPYPGQRSKLPVAEVLRVLDDLAPPEAVGRLAELAAHPTTEVRRAAAGSLGNLATESALPAWLAVSRDPDDGVQRSAVWGVSSALTAGRVAPAFAAGVFDRVAEWLDYDGTEYDVVHGAAGVLCRLDPERARPLFLDPQRFSAANRRLCDLLEATDEYACPLPPERVKRLLDDLRPRADDYFVGRSIHYLLNQLVRQRSPAAARYAESAVGWASPGSDGAREIGLAAADTLARLNGVTAPVDVVLGRLQAGEPLGPEQQAFYVAWVLNAEVCNGGFAQYLANSSGGTARESAAALELIGAPAHAALAGRAAALFGPAGPAVGRDARQEQLAALPPSADAELDGLSTAYYESPGDIPALLTAFAGRHPEQFRTADAG